MHGRILRVCGERSTRTVGSLVDMSPETVRRILRGQRPRVEFLINLSQAMEISGDWLLTGRGLMHTKDQVAAALQQASELQLWAELGARLESEAGGKSNQGE